MKIKKITAIILCLLMSFSLVACGSSSTTTTQTTDDTTIRIGSLSGPTTMGLVKLMEANENGKSKCKYEFAEISTDPTVYTTGLANGTIDIAMMPANAAAALYNKTNGAVKVLAVNTLGVLKIVTKNGETLNSISELQGKTLYATGQGAVPEYALEEILAKNNVSLDSVNINWCADTTEAMSHITNDTDEAYYMLPEPFVTTASQKVQGLKIIFDLNTEWNKVETEAKLVTGVAVVRKEFLEQHEALVNTFLSEYEESISYTNENPKEASVLIEKYMGIKQAIAEKAIPECHIIFAKGSDMKKMLSGFLEILYKLNSASIGGKEVKDDFYYGV